MMSATLRLLPDELTVVSVQIDPKTNLVTLNFTLREMTTKKGDINKAMRIIMTPEERKMLREQGSIGGKLSSSRLSKRQRRARASKAALARWEKAATEAALASNRVKKRTK